MQHQFTKVYKNLYFDLDRTLWDYQSNSEKTLVELIDKYVPELTNQHTDFLSVFYEINDKMWLQYRDGKLKKEILVTKRFSDALEVLGVESNGRAQIISDDYIKNSPYKTGLFPHAIETLKYLKKRGYRMFLLTNGFLEVQTVKIRESKLEPFFEKMITSEEAGYQKPNRKAFEYAVKTVNAKKDESIMIGDDIENDILGAKRFGMDTIFFNPEGNATEIKPTFEIKGLDELKSIL